MFVSINLDFATIDSKNKVIRVLKEYALKKVQENLYESYTFPVKRIGVFKKDITKCLDMDDRIRIYQYPIENTFTISYVQDRKWKRLKVSL